MAKYLPSARGEDRGAEAESLLDKKPVPTAP